MVASPRSLEGWDNGFLEGGGRWPALVRPMYGFIRSAGFRIITSVVLSCPIQATQIENP